MAADSRTVEVRGLPGSVRDAAFRQMFESFGPIAASRFLSRPGFHGSGFVTFCLRESAQSAIHALNGSEVQGTRIQVKTAEAGAGARHGLVSARAPASSAAQRGRHINVYVSNWPVRLPESAFRNAFETYGDVLSVTLFSARQRAGRVYGFVLFASHEGAQKAITDMDGKPFDGSPLQVRAARYSQRGFTDDQKRQTTQQLSEEGITGTVKAWINRYGWIVPDQPVDHPAASMHNGQVYIHIRDVEGAVELQPGWRVSFATYANIDGIGASNLRVLSQGGADVDDTRQRSRFDGKIFAFPASSASSAAIVPTQHICRWWSILAGDCCPLTLTPLEDLEREPFGILGVTNIDNLSPDFGIWGEHARTTLASTPDLPVHWSDGISLACSLVSRAQFIDPVNRRALSAGECESLDQYLDDLGLPAVQVAEAFRLSQESRLSATSRERLESLSRDAASLMRIFDEGPPESFETPFAGSPDVVDFGMKNVSPTAARWAKGECASQESGLHSAVEVSSEAPRQRRWGRAK